MTAEIIEFHSISIKFPRYSSYTSNSQKLRLGLLVLFVLMVIGLLKLDDKRLILLCGIGATGLGIWQFYEMQISKNISVGTKRRSWTYLFSLAVLIYLMVTRLSE